MSTHKYDAYGSLPLTVTNLKDSIRATSQTDKTQHVRDFVRSQETYLSHYSKEGRTSAVAWERGALGAGGNTPNRKTCSKEILASAFDTPILKPRVPASEEDLSERVEQPKGNAKNPTSEVEGSKPQAAKASKLKTRLVRSESQKENTPKGPEMQKENHCGLPNVREAPRKHAKQQTLDRYTAKGKADAQKEVSRKKRRRSPESTDSEHAARLAERRERRRAKRAIVAPNPTGATSDEEEGTTGVALKATKTTKGKKKKSTSLAAGLALMHGFTAKNIGRNRLTVQPERRNGVFSKGKASAKVGTSTKRTGAAAFSESQFLSAVKRSDKDCRQACDDTSSETSASSNTSVDRSPTKPTTRSPSGRSARKVLKVSAQNSDSSVELEPRKARPASSIVWDIEIDGKSLPSDSGSTELDRLQDGTIILDTHAKKWAVADPDLVKPIIPAQTVQEGEHHDCEETVEFQGSVDASADRSSTASLRPSESASQFPRHLLPLMSEPRVSRFFPSSGTPANDEPIPLIGREEPHFTRLSSQHTNCVFQASTAESPVFPIETHFLAPSHISAAHSAVDESLLDTRPSTCGGPVSMSMSVLDRELRALDDDDQGLLYAVHTQGYASEEYSSALSAAQPDPLIVCQPRSGLYSFGNVGLEASSLGSSPSDPDLYPRDRQEEYLGAPVENWDYATDAEAGSVHPADFLDVDGEFYSQQLDVEETTMAPGLGFALEDTVLYFDEEDATDASGLPPILGPYPYDDDVCMSDPQDFTEVALEHSDTVATDSRPHTATSWCSATDVPSVPDSSSAVASASELSTELLVPSFAQGRDLLLGLSERSGIGRNPYSMTSVEEDVAKNLRGHWLPQRL